MTSPMRGSTYLRLACGVLTVALVAGLASPALAQGEPSEDALIDAKIHFEAGKTYYQKKKFRQAITEFEEGYTYVKKPAFLVNIAQCYRELGNQQKAREYYKRFLDEDPQTPQREQVEAIIAELDAEIGAPAAAPTAGADMVITPEETGATAPRAPRPPPPAPEPSAEDEAKNLLAQSGGSGEVEDDERPDAEVTHKRRHKDEEPKEDKEAKPFYAKPWFWTVVGLAVVGGATGAYFATRDPGYVSEGSLGNIDARRK